MDIIGRYGPGLLLCGVGGLLALAASHWVSSVSALLFAVALGTLTGNLRPVPQGCRPGVAVASRRVLRLGIVLLGLQLVVGDVVQLGWGVVGVVVAVVTLGILGTVGAGRLLGVPAKQRLLIACGFSICGAAAVAATDGVVDAEDDDVATAVALVVLFGTLMIPLVPLLVELQHLSPTAGGIWAGGSIHEVAQVVAAAGIIGPEALQVAVVVKLARVLMLAPVMAVLSVRARRSTSPPADVRRPPLVPLFVVGFVAMVALASLHVVPPPVLAVGRALETWFLAVAMFALGLGVRVKGLLAVGPKPFVLGLVSTAIVSATALAGITLAV